MHVSCIIKPRSETSVSSPGWGPAPSTSMLMAPGDAPPAPGASRTCGIGSSSASVSHGTATIHSKLEETRAKSPMLVAGSVTKGWFRGVVGHAVGQRMIGVIKVRLLSPKHHLLHQSMSM
jgi:hypothetical protein